MFVIHKHLFSKPKELNWFLSKTESRTRILQEVMPVKYVAVKHQPDNDISYWFEVPCNLEDAVAVGKDVLCNTRRGDMTGYIVSIMDGVPEDVAVRIIGNRFPLKNILAVSAEFKVPDIFVPWELTQEIPEPDEIAQRINEFYEYGSFRIPVSFTDTGTLLDGYSAYLVAKMFGHETLKGYCVAPQ